MEEYRIKRWRCAYLRKIKAAKESGKKLIYLDETSYNVGEAADKIWTDDTAHTMKKAPVSHRERLIIVHAGSHVGWVPGEFLVLRTKGPGNYDYHKDTDSFKF